MFVYEIVNAVNGKRYVGATTNFSRRRNEHLSSLRRNVHTNPHLQCSWNKYGEQSFSINVIAQAKTLIELDELENEFINRSAEYNIKSGGLKNFKHSDATKQKISRSCLGRPSPTKGMRFVRSERVRDNFAKLSRLRKYPILVSPDETEIQIVNVRRFSEEHKLQQSGVRQLVDGCIDYYRGWTRKGTHYVSRGHTISHRKRVQRYPQVVSPNGDIYSIDVLREFCRNHSLSVGCMSQLVNGLKPSHVGWKLLEK